MDNCCDVSDEKFHPEFLFVFYFFYDIADDGDFCSVPAASSYVQALAINVCTQTAHTTNSIPCIYTKDSVPNVSQL